MVNPNSIFKFNDLLLHYARIHWICIPNNNRNNNNNKYDVSNVWRDRSLIRNVQ